MSYTNLNNPANYQLQSFGQDGMRTISTTQAYVEGEYYRVLVATEDSTLSATSMVGDDLASIDVYAGTTIYGLFTAVTVTAGEVTAYLAGRTDIDDVWAYIRAYGEANGATIEGEDCAKAAISPLLDKYYAKASLVMVPSLYKTSIVYSERPLSTDGELTFSRASSATRVGPDGYIEKVRTNLLLQSNSFDTTWTIPNGTPTSGQAGYNGTNNAWLFNYVSAPTMAAQVLSKTGYQAFSVYAKGSVNNGLRMYAFGGVNSYAFFNLNTGTVEGNSGLISSKIEDAGNGFYRCSISFDKTTTSLYLYLSNNADAPAASGSIILQDAQLETGDIATDYIPTTTTAVSVGPVANLPRLNYPINSDGSVGCPSLLLEPQTTALNQFSEQIDNAWWSLSRTSAFGSGSVVNAVTSPDGTQSAEYVQQASGQTSGGGLFRTILLSTGSYTLSVFAKKGEQRYLRLGGAFAAGGFAIWCNFDLETGTIGTPDAGVTPKIDNYGNGWYRCSITANKVDLTGQNIFLYQSNTLNGSDATPLSGLYLWGANLTQTAYPTSYIPTLGASVTRLADAASKTGIASLIGQTEGTIFAEINFDLGVTAQADSRIHLSDGTTSNWIFMGLPDGSSGNLLRMYVNTPSSSMSAYSTNPVVNGVNKIAFGYKSGSFVLYVNGVQAATSSTTLTMAACSRIDLQGNAPAASAQERTNYKQLLLFKTRLTNAQLAELTTL